MFSNWLLHLQRVHHINLFSTKRRHWFTNLVKHHKNLWCWNNTVSLDSISKLSLRMHNHSKINIFPSIGPQIVEVQKKETWGLRLQQCQEPTISIHFIQKKCHRTIPSALTSSKVSKAITSGRAVEEDEPARCPISFQEVHSKNYRSFDWTRRS